MQRRPTRLYRKTRQRFVRVATAVPLLEVVVDTCEPVACSTRPCASMIYGREVKSSTILLTGSGPLFVSQVEISPAATVGMARKAQKKAEKRAAKKEKKRANSFESIRYQRQAQKAMDEL